MNNDFWVNITKPRRLYVVEKWSVGEDRILYVEKRRAMTRRGAKKYAKRCIMDYICDQYIKEKK